MVLWAAIFYVVTQTALWKNGGVRFFSSLSSGSTVVFGSQYAGTYALPWTIATLLLGVLSLFLTRNHRHWLTFAAFILVSIGSVFLLRTFSALRSVADIFLSAITLFAGITAILIADFYRKSYKYYITNFRIAMIRKFLTYNEVYTRYENLVDIDVTVSFLGRIFSFGSIVPITSAGLGMGANYSGRGGVNGAVSVKGIDVPRAKPSECFFGVKHPYTIRNEIAEYMQKSSSSYELKQIQDALKPKTSN
ncbi:MAG: PH domain-containing protein [Thermoplasmata archaeon]|nr:PH domain-containing protein [Candidatus Sysuiplasma acidicola]MBX8637892.1 PH domain-containing protein [Candidatus Sysuiplasma acidicola]MBX8646966.1 PH domain-containing protein [Candidatus Sysuiplasma acidicola]MDH2905490.1 PH domain-containing protein [Methanomassiliicoccales archaeon]